jgi:hypothetical protein
MNLTPNLSIFPKSGWLYKHVVVNDEKLIAYLLKSVIFALNYLRYSEYIIKCDYMCSNRVMSAKNIKTNEVDRPKYKKYNFQNTSVPLECAVAIVLSYSTIYLLFIDSLLAGDRLCGLRLLRGFR